MPTYVVGSFRYLTKIYVCRLGLIRLRLVHVSSLCKCIPLGYMSGYQRSRV